MKTRIISAAAALVLLAAVMLLGREALGAAVFIAALIGMHEFYAAMEAGGCKPVKPIGYISCLYLMYLTFGNALNTGFPAIATLAPKVLSLAVFIMIAALFLILVFRFEKYRFTDMAVTIMGIFYVVFLFSFVILVRNIDNGGHLYIWLVFAGAWAPDTAAYFTGVAFGRTKILPVVSPKKSLEGSIGGVVGCMAVMAAVGLFLNSKGIYANGIYTGDLAGIPVYHYLILGLLCGIVSQVGDWAASAVKRQTGIKDYGRLMPGHGGVLDRFDSILFAAPAVYFYLTICLSV